MRLPAALLGVRFLVEEQCSLSALMNGQSGAVGSYLYFLGIMPGKLSPLLSLYCIFRVNLNFRIATWALGLMLVVWSTISILLMIFSCRTVKAN